MPTIVPQAPGYVPAFAFNLSVVRILGPPTGLRV
jgi:hypothetical protein